MLFRSGLLTAAEFITIAEESGLITPLGDWALHEACRQAAAWQQLGQHHRIAVNVSARQIASGTIAETILRIFKETGCDPRTLELEITEDTLTKHAAAVMAAMTTLGPLGTVLAINGFGSSYASLAHLRRVPICKVKINPTLIRNIDDPHDAAIVR